MRKSWECSGDLLSPSFSHLSKPELCVKPFYPIYCIIPIPRLIPGKEITLLMQTLNTLSTSEEKLAALCKKYAELVSPGAGGGRGSSGRHERDIPGTHWSFVVSWDLCSAGFLAGRGWVLPVKRGLKELWPIWVQKELRSVFTHTNLDATFNQGGVPSMDQELEEFWGCLCTSKVSVGGFSLCWGNTELLAIPAGWGFRERKSPWALLRSVTNPLSLGCCPLLGPSPALLPPHPVLPSPSWRSTGTHRSR